MTDSRTGKVTGAAGEPGGADKLAATSDQRQADRGTEQGRPASDQPQPTASTQPTQAGAGGPARGIDSTEPARDGKASPATTPAGDATVEVTVAETATTTAQTTATAADAAGPVAAVAEAGAGTAATATASGAAAAESGSASAQDAAAGVTAASAAADAATVSADATTVSADATTVSADATTVSADATTAEAATSATPADQAPAADEAAPADGEAPVEGETASSPLAAELAALRGELEERTKDLQRITAEYANYRKRVERDKGLVADQAIASVLAALLPILDDLDRAREHGDLVGPFGAVAEQLTSALSKYGLTPFGEKGDAFDPTRHEAVAHEKSSEVTEPTCVEVMRRGYLLGDRLLRPALVAVADPK